MMSTRLLETCRELKQTYRKRIVRQFGHLQELYRDARSTEHKKIMLLKKLKSNIYEFYELYSLPNY
jgi:hypothetical protein